MFPSPLELTTKKTDSLICFISYSLNPGIMKTSIKFLLTSTLIASMLMLNGCSGSDGEVGPKGDTGTANVIYSGWISTPFSGSGSTYTASLSVPKLTQEMLDKADIRVYWSEGGRVLTLPYAQTLSGTSYTVHQRFYLGRIDFVANYSISTQSFRYVIIPGGESARKKSLSQMSYEEVKSLYNMPD